MHEGTTARGCQPSTSSCGDDGCEGRRGGGRSTADPLELLACLGLAGLLPLDHAGVAAEAAGGLEGGAEGGVGGLKGAGEGTDFSMREVFSGPMLKLIGKSIPDMSEAFEAFARGLKARSEGSDA